MKNLNLKKCYERTSARTIISLKFAFSIKNRWLLHQKRIDYLKLFLINHKFSRNVQKNDDFLKNFQFSINLFVKKRYSIKYCIVNCWDNWFVFVPKVIYLLWRIQFWIKLARVWIWPKILTKAIKEAWSKTSIRLRG